MNTNPYAPPAANVEDIVQATEAPAPALWNPSAAARWSLLFGPIFGAILHTKNWQALGEPEKAAQSKKWLFSCIGFFLVLVVSGAILPDSKAIDGAFRAAGIGILIAWYAGSARSQIGYVKERFGDTYPRKGWGLPLLYAFLAIVAFFAVIVGLVFAVDMLTGEG